MFHNEELPSLYEIRRQIQNKTTIFYTKPHKHNNLKLFLLKKPILFLIYNFNTSWLALMKRFFFTFLQNRKQNQYCNCAKVEAMMTYSKMLCLWPQYMMFYFEILKCNYNFREKEFARCLTFMRLKYVSICSCQRY